MTQSHGASSPVHSPVQSMFERITGGMIQQMLYEVARLNVADLIQAGETSVDVLARVTGTNANVLYRVLRALAGYGIFVETQSRHFALTPEAETLCADARVSLRPLLMLVGSDWALDAWTHLDHSIRTGQPAFDVAHGDPLFDHLQKNREHADVYHGAMTGRTGYISKDIATSYDFSPFKTLMDVGGGEGILLTTILANTPGLQGVLFDLPGISTANPLILDDSGVADRCTIIEGDFFEPIPAGPDAIIMKSIIHDWNDESAREILKNCSKCLAPSGTLLLCEFIVPDKNLPGMSKLMDLEMLVMSGGAERTEEEFRTLLASAGFTLDRVVPTRKGLYLLESSVA